MTPSKMGMGSVVLSKEEEGGAGRANDVVKVEGCGWVGFKSPG